MTNKKNKKAPKSNNPWLNQDTGLELMKKHFPNLPEAHLLRCWRVFIDDKKKCEKERREFHRMLDEKPLTYKLGDFDNSDEIKGSIVYNGEKYEEQELLKSEQREPTKKELVDDKDRFVLIEE